VFVEDFAAKLPTPPQFTVCALRLFERWFGGEELVAGDSANGVRAKFRIGVARFGELVILNFDLTPFASPHLLLVCFAAVSCDPAGWPDLATIAQCFDPAGSINRRWMAYYSIQRLIMNRL
jgi:hypothetical protein